MHGKKICVAFETAGSWLGISVMRMDAPEAVQVKNFFKETGPRQSDLLIPTLKKMLTGARVQKKDISLLSVDVGPGSFTGVRIGVAAARTLAQVLQIPLVGVTSLESMVWQVSKKTKIPIFISVMPALQGDVYFSAYHRKTNSDYSIRQAPTWKKTIDLEKYLLSLAERSDVCVIVETWREDLVRLKEKFPQFQWVEDAVYPHPRAVAEVAIDRFRKTSKSYSFEKVIPLYLQPSWAERTRHAQTQAR